MKTLVQQLAIFGIAAFLTVQHARHAFAAPANTTIESPTTQPVVPEGWIEVQTGPFSFFAPAETRLTPVQGIDSFVGQYAGAGVKISFDYGQYSNSLTEYRTGRLLGENVVIGGKEARLVKSPDGVQIHFPVVDQQDFGSGRVWINKLTFSAMYDGAPDEKKAEAIVRSIRFTPKPDPAAPTPNDGWMQIVAGDILTFAVPPETVIDDSPTTRTASHRYRANGLRIFVETIERSLRSEPRNVRPVINALATPIEIENESNRIVVCFAQANATAYSGPALIVEFDNLTAQQTALRIAHTVDRVSKEFSFIPASEAPVGWTGIALRDLFSLSAPPGKVTLESRPDSVIHGDHRMNFGHVSFDFGDSLYWRTQEPRPGEEYEFAVIGGKNALTDHSQSSTTSYFTNLPVGPDAKPERLYLYVGYGREGDAKWADSIVRSVRFSQRNDSSRANAPGASGQALEYWKDFPLGNTITFDAPTGLKSLKTEMPNGPFSHFRDEGFDMIVDFVQSPDPLSEFAGDGATMELRRNGESLAKVATKGNSIAVIFPESETAAAYDGPIVRFTLQNPAAREKVDRLIASIRPMPGASPAEAPKLAGISEEYQRYFEKAFRAARRCVMIKEPERAKVEKREFDGAIMVTFLLPESASPSVPAESAPFPNFVAEVYINPAVGEVGSVYRGRF